MIIDLSQVGFSKTPKKLPKMDIIVEYLLQIPFLRKSVIPIWNPPMIRFPVAKATAQSQMSVSPYVLLILKSKPF